MLITHHTERSACRRSERRAFEPYFRIVHNTSALRLWRYTDGNRMRQLHRLMSRDFSRLFLFAMVVAAALMRCTAQDHRCLDKIYPVGESRLGAKFQFDQGFDGDAGGAYSCDLQMRPSELRVALDRFRNAVLYHDSRSVIAVVGFPVKAHVHESLEANSKVKTLTIRNVSEWYSFQDRYFTPIHKALVDYSYLDNVTAAGGRSPGVMIGLGAFWFQSSLEAGR